MRETTAPRYAESRGRCGRCGRHEPHSHPELWGKEKMPPGGEDFKVERATTSAATEKVYAVGVIRCYDESGNEVETYVEGGPGKMSLIAMSDGTVRWAK